jgi:hypothetical protein
MSHYQSTEQTVNISIVCKCGMFRYVGTAVNQNNVHYQIEKQISPNVEKNEMCHLYARG